MRQKFLCKIKVNKKFWYIEDHVKVIEGVHIGAGLALIDGKYIAMNPHLMVYTSDPRKGKKQIKAL